MDLLKRKIKLLNGCTLTEKIIKCTYKHSRSTAYFHDIEIKQGRMCISSGQQKIDEKTAVKIFKYYQNEK